MLVILAMTVFPPSNDSLLMWEALPFSLSVGLKRHAARECHRQYAWLTSLRKLLLQCMGFTHQGSRLFWHQPPSLVRFDVYLIKFDITFIHSARPFKSEVQGLLVNFFSQSIAYLLSINDGSLRIDIQPGGCGPFCGRG